MKQKNYLVANATVRQTYDKIAESECFLRAIGGIMLHLKLVKQEIEAWIISVKFKKGCYRHI